MAASAIPAIRRVLSEADFTTRAPTPLEMEALFAGSSTDGDSSGRDSSACGSASTVRLDTPAEVRATPSSPGPTIRMNFPPITYHWLLRQYGMSTVEATTEAIGSLIKTALPTSTERIVVENPVVLFEEYLQSKIFGNGIPVVEDVEIGKTGIPLPKITWHVPSPDYSPYFGTPFFCKDPDALREKIRGMPKRIETIAQATELLRYFKSTVPWIHEEGCEARAIWMTAVMQGLLDMEGIEKAKVSTTSSIKGYTDMYWRFHTSPLITVKGIKYAIDSILYDPITYKDWLEEQQRNSIAPISVLPIESRWDRVQGFVEIAAGSEASCRLEINMSEVLDVLKKAYFFTRVSGREPRQFAIWFPPLFE